MSNQYCLFCDSSISADAMDGSQVLVCFDCDGHEGKEMQVDDDGCCANYNGPECCCASNTSECVFMVDNLDSLPKADINRIAKAVERTQSYIRKD